MAESDTDTDGEEAYDATEALGSEDWYRSELGYEDRITEGAPVPVLFSETAEERAEETAQMYKGGVYDRSLVPEAVDEAPDGGFASLTYAEMYDVVRTLAVGFDEVGVSKGGRVGIFGDTRLEWAVSDLALLSRGATVTSVYASSSPKQTRYLLGDPDASGVVVENAELLDKVMEVEDELSLDFVVSMDTVETERGEDGEGPDVYTLEDVYGMGDERGSGGFEGWLDSLSPDDLCTLIYTSGTTGQPKGVRLTYRNFASSMRQVHKRFGREGDGPSFSPDDRMVSFLPLAHSFERLAGHFYIFAMGATVAYAESPDTLREDFSKVRPTAGTSVPRVYEKMYEAIREQASGSSVGERVFGWATEVGREYHAADEPGPVLGLKYAVADRLVFSEVREALGGEVEFFISGGGSLSAELCSLYHGMGLPIYEGYGLTETAPAVALNPPEAPEIGTIGAPLCEMDVRLDGSQAGDLEPVSGGEVGELLVRGENVFDGYWEKPGETDEAMDGDWFRTGDVVEIRPDGYIQFRERVKQLLVLSTGKNVAPGPIEDAFATSELVEQCMVIGDDEKFVGALIVPNPDGVRRRAEEEGVSLPDGGGFVDDDRVRGWIQEEVDRINQGFERFERVKRFALVGEEWTEENGMLTPSLKKKRRRILERHSDAVEGIYGD